MPSASNSLIRSALPDADNPRTLIKAAIPIVMPSAERAERSLRVRSPELPTRSVSKKLRRLLGNSIWISARSVMGISRHSARIEFNTPVLQRDLAGAHLRHFRIVGDQDDGGAILIQADH